MADDASSGRGADLSRFRRLCGWTIGATLVLIVIGGIVRVSDSGLGCGPAGSGSEGWPLCGGRALPFLETNAVVEFSHRAAATIVTVLIGALALLAWRRLRERRFLVRGTIAAGVLVLAQAALGGLTVEQGLDEELVAAHLGLAMLLLGLLIVLRSAAREPEHKAPETEAPRALRATALVAGGLLLATIVAGGYVAGTEGEGKANEPVLGAHLACGEQFPTCVDRFMPFGESRLIDIQLTHRALMYLTAIAVLGMVALAFRRRPRSPVFAAAAGLLFAQILLGALNVWLGKQPALIVGHLALGTVLWGTVVQANASLYPFPAQFGARLGARATAGAPA